MLLEPTELEKVERWRLEELLKAGYSPRLASRIAADPSVDLREACDLVGKRGCPPELAGRILL
jgi:hypothetical protein